MVVLDVAWHGSPGAEAIRQHIGTTLKEAWDQYAVIAIEPELEAWVWQDNPHVSRALKCCPDFRVVLLRAGLWPAGSPKPPDPKAALEYLRRKHRADPSNAAFRRLAENVSVKGCVDPAFNELRDTLRTWFA